MTSIVTIAQLLPIVIIPIIVIIPTAYWNYLYLFLNIFVLVVEFIIFEQKNSKFIHKKCNYGSSFVGISEGPVLSRYTIISTVSII